MISASPGARGAAGAAADLRKVLTISGASVVAATLAVPPAFARFTADGRLADPELGRQLRAVTEELLQAADGQRRAA